MVLILTERGINKKLEVEGVWCEFEGECKFLIARWQNPQHRKKLERITPKRRKLSNEEASNILHRSMFETVVLAWEGVLADADKPLEFTEEHLCQLFVACPDVYDFCFGEANDLRNFREEALETVAGN